MGLRAEAEVIEQMEEKKMKTQGYKYTEHGTGRKVEFDYGLQVWVIDGIIQNCGHPDDMRPGCCNGDKFKGMTIEEAGRQA